MVPFVATPQVWLPPALIWTKVLVGGVLSPTELSPQQVTVLSGLIPQVWALPALIWVYVGRGRICDPGGVLWPRLGAPPVAPGSPAPQQAAVPSVWSPQAW
jgi:hypothetical protein